MDIKELALKVAKEMNWRMDEMTLETFATRLIAAYCEGQEQVAWDGAEEWEQLAWNLCAEEGGEESCIELLWDGGLIPEPWGDRWLKYEGEAKRMISLVRKFAAPPEPAPQMPLGVSEGAATSACAAPSSEEVREMVDRLRDDRWILGMKDRRSAANLIERLAARVPDGCVVVPMGPTEAMCLAGQDHPGCYQVFKAMIAAYKGPSNE